MTPHVTNDVAIELNDLTLRFDGRPVLEDFSLHVSAGEKVTLTGPSGSGKSSILRSILGFVTPERGSVRIAGELVTSWSIWHLRRRLAYVPQEADLGVGPVRAILQRPFAYRANARLRHNEHLVPDMFERFHLPIHLLDKDVTDLSGGEKQRVAIVSAVLLNRSIVLLDEAASALDREMALVVANYFRGQRDLTVVSAAHNAQALPLSEQVVSLVGGTTS
jgi:ABC-type iron transport system FetAB ATPase subunit